MKRRKIYGVATISERGQIVIPQEAREDLNLKPGDKMIVLGFGPKNGLTLIKSELFLELFNELSENLTEIERFIFKLKEGKEDVNN
ncbi:MAG: AbrB/MazE/SpoVT family DNA-binding domain-containing protein [Dictyoglomaceae bacterium]|nr:AbrB/MazE/SpoVT family DNA-binding domain-containing protein [Dictyoglomaceae bacterium]